MAQEFVLNKNINVRKYGFSNAIYTINYNRNIESDADIGKAKATIIDENNYGKANNIINKLSGKVPIIIVKAKDDEFNRKILENKKISILLSPELYNKKDKLKQRNSGLNHVSCKIAAENNISIGIDLKNIIYADEKEKAKLLSRIKQNIKLCRKAKTKMIFSSFAETEEQMRSIKDSQALCRVLGMDTKMAKNAVEKDFIKLKID